MSSIGSTINSINTSLLSEIQSLSATKTADKSAKARPPVAGADRVDFSKVGKVFSELEQLQKSDPVGLKQVLTDAASKLNEAANQTTDPKTASFLNDLAGRFEKAADTGDLTSLRQQARSGVSGPGGHHGHHHHVQEADNNSDDQSSSATSKPPPRLLGPPALPPPPAPPEVTKANEESTDNLAITTEATQPSREERFLPATEPTTESFIASTREERSQTSIPAPGEHLTSSPETVSLLGPPEPAPIENVAGKYHADRYAFHDVQKADNYSEDGGSSTPIAATPSEYITNTEPSQFSQADRFLPPPEPPNESSLRSTREELSQSTSPANTVASILTSSPEGTDSGRIGRLLLQFVSNNSNDAS